MNTHPEVTVVIPCLNEAETIGTCVREALAAFASGSLEGEVVVADNGSRDGSQEIALASGARVVDAPLKGYGAALMAGIEAARGELIVMGDADGSYNFGDTPRLIAVLRDGAELAPACRLPAGGGSVDHGAMPWSHRWVGNPILTWLARWMFGTPVHDVYCGLRGFRKSLYHRLNLRCTGMEFATEMIIKAALHHVPTKEISTTLRRDGRGGRPPHLRTFRDGWRTLRLFLLFSPLWLHIVPGLLLCMFGLVLSILAITGVKLGPATLGAHSLLVAAMALLVGQQALWIGVFTRTFAAREGIHPTSPRVAGIHRLFSLERSLGVAASLIIAGLALIIVVLVQWHEMGFGQLEYAQTMLKIIPGITCVAAGTQFAIGGFALGLLNLARK